MHTEIFLLVISLLFFASIFTDKLSSKFGVPALLLFLGVGMLFGEDGFGIQYDDPDRAQLIGSMALCVILFAGGMSTKFADIKPVVKEGAVLATLGVLLTWLISGFTIWAAFRYFGKTQTVSVPFALLLAATMSSTDAGSVFSILGTKGIRLKHNLRPMLELESGSNDPMAYVITITMISVITSPEPPNVWQILFSLVWSMLFGLVVGFGFGKLMIWIMKRVTISNTSLYPIMILTACIFMYSASFFLGGNSYLAVYIGGLVIGNSKFPYKRQTMGFIDGLSWLSQLMMFLVLGLLVTPHQLGSIVLPALIVSTVIIFIARPISVFVSLLPFKNVNLRSKTYLSWVGLKGAVPIILAIQCAASGVGDSDFLFNVAFFCTIVSLLLQGVSLSSLAVRLGLTLPKAAKHEPTHFDVDLPEEIREQAMEIPVTEEMVGGSGTHLMDVGLGRNSLVIMLRRGDEYIIPNGQTLIYDGDFLLVMADEQHALVRTYDENLWEIEFVENTGQFLREQREKHKEVMAKRQQEFRTKRQEFHRKQREFHEQQFRKLRSRIRDKQDKS